MKRREFLIGVGAALALALPLTAVAQRTGRRHVGMLLPINEGDTLVPGRIAALREGLASAGWVEGDNLDVTWKFVGNDVVLAQQSARELAELDLDAAFSASTPVTMALERNVPDVPIVFAGVSDPIGSGFVQSLAHPGGRLTGYLLYEASLGGKWIELLIQVAPSTERIGVLFNPETAPGRGEYFMPAMRTAAAVAGVELLLLSYQQEAEIEGLITSLAAEGFAALAVYPDLSNQTYRETIIRAVAQEKLPAIQAGNTRVFEGGLIAYSVNLEDLWRRAMGYLGRVLDGFDPRDLPVQTPAKYDLAINLGTAAAQNIVIPVDLLAIADILVE